MEVSSDPTYTHFSHAAEFFELFDRFIQLHVTEECVDQEQAEAEDKLVDSIGSIVSCIALTLNLQLIFRSSSTTIYPCRHCLIHIFKLSCRRS
jgi:hypothetical protein